MLWKGGRESSNVEDRSGMRMGRGIVGGGIGAIVLTLIGLFFGIDPRNLVDTSGTDFNSSGGSTATSTVDPATKTFVSKVLGYTEDTWAEIFRQQGGTYHPPRLVLYADEVDTACGFGQAAMGPFYCPSDREVYLDTTFFQELKSRFGAPGEFAEAYVIAHEIGHHVQNLLGISEQANAAQNRSSQTQANAISVRVELQADCLAGVWAINTQRREEAKGNGFLETGDVDQALAAASMIGDDKLQMRARGYVVPETFTHGTSEQRVRWFKTGFNGGTIASCDTFR
jgi:predicted metalloprotease